MFGLPRSALGTSLLLVPLVVAAACNRSPSGAAKQPPQLPAKVAHPAHEDELNTVELTLEARQRLGIEIGKAALRPLRRQAVFGGEIMLPTGASLVVSAPLGGTLEAPTAGGVPAVGTTVKRGQPIFSLIPLLSPERAVLTPAERIRFAEARNAVAQSRIDAEGQVQQASVQVSAARINLERAERLLREQAGTVRAVDDAQAQLTLAQKALDAARNRKELVDNIKLDEEAGNLTPLVMHAPQDGILRARHAAPGEAVTAAAPLFEVMDCDPVWVRVPVYAGEAGQFDPVRPAEITSIADPPGAARKAARPIAAPPTATVLASTIDLYFELENPRAELRPGQRVTARLTLAGSEQSLAIPWPAVVYDVQGGAWVYEELSKVRFARRRVQVRYVVDGWAVLAGGLSPGTAVVTAGAVELFGTEFGFAK